MSNPYGQPQFSPYQQPQQGYPPQNAYPSQPQPGYGAPYGAPPQQHQQGAFPPQQYAQYPQQGAYPPQQFPPQYPPQNYVAPQQQPQQYAPAYGAPPYGAPPQQHQQYPPQNYSQPPQQQGYPAQPAYGAQQPAYNAQPYAPAQGGYPAQAPPAGGHQITCNPVADANALKAAMKGLGTDEEALIRIIAARNPAEIEAIKMEYAKLHGKDLIAAVESETGGKFGKVMHGLLLDPRQYDADTLHKAMKGLGTNEKVLIQFLVGRNPQQIAAVKEKYHRTYGKSLDDRVKSEVGGDLGKLLHQLILNRDVEGPVNEDVARADAERLYSAGEGKLGTDEKVFIEIFARKSWSHLKRVFAIYETIHKHHTMERAVESEFSGDLKYALVGIVVCARNPAEFWADIIHKSVAGAGTDDSALIHAIVGNRDLLPQIKTAYSAKYNKSLWGAISGDTSGDYKKALLTIIGN